MNLTYQRPKERCPIMKIHVFQYFKDDQWKCKHCGYIVTDAPTSEAKNE